MFYLKERDVALVLRSCLAKGREDAFYLKERDVISTPSATWRVTATRSVTVSRNSSVLRSRLAKGREDVFYLTTLSTHFNYGYMVNDIQILLSRTTTEITL